MLLAFVLAAASHGLLLSTDCEAVFCESHTVEVSKKFVRLPIKRQLATMTAYCRALANAADDYEREDGTPVRLKVCEFRYHGFDVGAWTARERIELDPDYVAALAALRD